MSYLATGFQAADGDTTGSLKTCLSSIDAHPFFRSVKDESYQLLRLTSSSLVLEVGCGIGTDAWRLSEMIGESGLIIGIDPGRSMITDACAKEVTPFSSLCNQKSPHFMQMDGRYLGFPDMSFDAIREDRALQHIKNPELVIREIFRVLRPDGRFVIFEPDWELFIIEGSGKALTRSILNYWADKFMNGWIGRSLPRLCYENGARTVTIEPKTLILQDLSICNEIFGIRDTVCLAVSSGIITSYEGDSWISYLEHSDREGRFFCSFTGFLLSGTK